MQATAKLYSYSQGQNNHYHNYTNQYYAGYVFTSSCHPPTTQTTFTVYLMRSSAMYLPTLSSAYTIGYRQVSINHEQPGGGREEHEFQVSMDNYDVLTMYGQFYMFQHPMTNFGWNTGQKLFERYFNEDGIPVKYVKYDYVVDPRHYGDKYFAAVEQFYPVSPVYNYNRISEHFNVSRYAILSKWQYLSAKTETVFDVNGQNPMITQTNYYHDNLVHTQRTRVSEQLSDGSRVVTHTSYPHDYTDSVNFIGEMKQGHLIGYAIEQLKYKEVGTTRTVLSGSITTYKPGGKGLADQVHMFETLAPLAQSSFKFSNRTLGQLPPSQGANTVFGRDTRYQPRITYNDYDDKGNLLQVTETGGPSTVYLWGYNGQYAVTSAKNATPADIAYAGFETADKGNWAYTGATIEDDTAPTGKRVYRLNGTATNLQKTGLTSTRSYLLTYWAKSASATGISGGTAIAMRSKGGWTQYRRVVTNVTSVTITGTGNLPIDDVRIHPLEASMDSYTYDPLIGMTSHTDASGTVFYYIYDDFGRLKEIKDLNGHVVEDYRYNYRTN